MADLRATRVRRRPQPAHLSRRDFCRGGRLELHWTASQRMRKLSAQVVWRSRASIRISSSAGLCRLCARLRPR